MSVFHLNCSFHKESLKACDWTQSTNVTHPKQTSLVVKLEAVVYVVVVVVVIPLPFVSAYKCTSSFTALSSDGFLYATELKFQHNSSVYSYFFVFKMTFKVAWAWFFLQAVHQTRETAKETNTSCHPLQTCMTFVLFSISCISKNPEVTVTDFPVW